MNQVIGIDFDNTLISYDNAMKQVALRLGLVDGDAETSKKKVKIKNDNTNLVIAVSKN